MNPNDNSTLEANQIAQLIFSDYEQGVQLKLSPTSQHLSLARIGSEILELKVTQLEVWGE